MIIFNERDFAVAATVGLSKKSYNLQEMTIYCKWLRWNIFNKKSDEEVVPLLKSTLINFCKLSWDGFDEDVEYQRINKAVSRALVEKLRTCDPIFITKKEWDIISSLPSIHAQKILFVMLVVGKYNRQNPIQNITQEPTTYTDTRLRVNLPLSELYKLAKIKYTKTPETYSIWAIYGQYNLIELVDSKTLKRILTFADLDPTSTPYITIHDFDNMIMYYEQQTNSRIKECPKCHKMFKDKTKLNHQKYCTPCRKKENKQVVAICEDCGKRISVADRGILPKKCKECQKQYRAEYNKKFWSTK